MKHPERIEDYLEHIAEAIELATEYLQKFATFALFNSSAATVIRNIEIIGEAASRIQRQAPEFVKAHPELPWLEMRGMRNKMIHNYFDVELTVVWSTVKEDLPQLKHQIDALLIEQRQTIQQEHPPPAGLAAQEKAFHESQDRQRALEQEQGPEQKQNFRQK